jgi:tripartite-type tricarboxylate transporter receptor subunit TctC
MTPSPRISKVGLDRREVIGCFLALTSLPTLAQNNKSIGKIIVPFAPGGARELPARAMYQEMARELGENWIIESHQGAGGAIGTSLVANSAPDGKTLLMAASSHFVTSALGAKPFYDPIKDFAPVANIGLQSYVLLSNTQTPFTSVAELIQFAKKHPGELNYGSAGIGSSTHLAMAYFCKTAGIDVTHVPYKGTQEATNDVLAARAQAVIVPTAGVGVYISDPRIRALAITAKKRSTLRPQIPTFHESGLKDFYFESWFGLLASAATPKPILERLNVAINKVISSEPAKSRLMTQGIEPANMGLEEFNQLFLADKELMTKMVKLVGLTRD